MPISIPVFSLFVFAKAKKMCKQCSMCNINCKHSYWKRDVILGFCFVCSSIDRLDDSDNSMRRTGSIVVTDVYGSYFRLETLFFLLFFSFFPYFCMMHWALSFWIWIFSLQQTFARSTSVFWTFNTSVENWAWPILIKQRTFAKRNII